MTKLQHVIKICRIFFYYGSLALPYFQLFFFFSCFGCLSIFMVVLLHKMHCAMRF